MAPSCNQKIAGFSAELNFQDRAECDNFGAGDWIVEVLKENTNLMNTSKIPNIATGSAHIRPFAQPPIATIGNLTVQVSRRGGQQN